MTDWYPSAQKVLGVASKRRAGKNPVKGVVCHSAEGYAAGLRAELANTTRSVQWHASILKDGTVWQHHPFSVRLNHAADTYGNDNLVGIEHEGVAGEALTPAQLASSVALVWWLADRYGFKPSRTGVAKTLYEHREISDTGTACPSNRIPWGFYLEPPAGRKPPPAKLTDWGMFYKNGAEPHAISTEGLGAGYEDHLYVVRIRRNVR